MCFFSTKARREEKKDSYERKDEKLNKNGIRDFNASNL